MQQKGHSNASPAWEQQTAQDQNRTLPSRDADPATDLAFSCLINATVYLSRKTVTPIKVMLAVGDQIFQAK